VGQAVDFTLIATNAENVPLHDVLFTDTLDPRRTASSRARTSRSPSV